MGDKRYKPAVPLEAAVKYIIRERDHYKDQLNKLIPYAKALESGRSEKISQLEAEVEKLRGRLERKNRDYEDLLRECAILKRDYRESAWFISLQENNKKLRETIKTLRKALNAALCENIKLKEDGTEEEHDA